MSYVLLDGSLVPEKEAQMPAFQGRAFKYGDAFFETILVHNGKAMYFHLHIQRLLKTARLLKYALPDAWNEAYFEGEIKKVIAANGVQNARLNITFARETSGFYLPEDKVFRVLISVEKRSDGPAYIVPEEGLILGEYREMIKTGNYISGLKTCNALIYVMASLFAQSNRMDECLILNDQGRVAECISSNIVLLKEDKLVSPPLSEYGIDGVMRKIIFQHASAYGYQTEEYGIYPEDLFGADEVWLTNVISGIRWVKEYRGKNYSGAAAQRMLQRINQSI